MAFKAVDFIGDPDRNRTCDLQIRNLPLYPTELRDHAGALIAFPRRFANRFVAARCWFNARKGRG